MGFFVNLLLEGQLLIITGNMGSGKSYFASVLTELAAKQGYHVYTNINFFDPYNWDKAKAKGLLNPDIVYEEPPANVHVVNKMSQLLRALPKTSPNIIILDESTIYAGYDRTGSKVLRWFKEFVVQTRKLNSSTILITQVKSQLTKLLREQLEHNECYCYKRGPYRLVSISHYNTPTQDGSWSDTIHGPIAKQTLITHLAYDTKSPASLIMDVNMEDWLSDASCYDSIELLDIVDEITNKWIQQPQVKRPMGRPVGWRKPKPEEVKVPA